MAFWGVEVKPSKPYSHIGIAGGGSRRLRISQATLGNGTSSKKSLLQCNVEGKASVYVCCLIPDTTESCSLNLEFQESDQVTFSVLGPRSVHLAGYYLHHASPPHDDDTDSYGEDIGDTESEHSRDLGSEDEYEDDFIDDADLHTFSPSPPRRKNGVVGEVLEDEEQVERKGNHKRLKKKYQVSDSDSDSRKENIIGGGSSIFVSGSDSDGDKRKEKIIGGGSSIFVSESEDEDSIPISSLSKAKVESAEVREKPDATAIEKNKKKHEHVGGNQVTGSKRKRQDDETERVFEKPKNVSLSSYGVGEENTEKKKEKSKRTKRSGEGSDSVIDVQDAKTQMEETKTNDLAKVHSSKDKYETPSRCVEPEGNHVDEGSTEERKKRKKKKKKKKTKTTTSESDQIVNAEETKEPEMVEK